MDQFISYKSEITDFLVNFLTIKASELKATKFSANVIKRLLPLVVGGKMWRGSLLINTYEKLVGQKYSPLVLQTAAALELIGTGLLVHDDIIDQDERRRNQTTLHIQYQQFALQKHYVQPRRFGESLAICSGDLLFFLAFGLLSAEMISLFSSQLSKTILGEMHDVELALMTGQEATKKDILQMYADKTASYTVSLPLMAGAMLAHQDQKLILQLNEVGQALGLIFQLKDDQLGLFGNEVQTGKAVGADIREGKKTLFYYYLEQAVPGALAENEIDRVLALIKKHRIRDLVANDLTTLAEKVKHQLSQLSAPERLSSLLAVFLQTNLSRKK